MIKCHHFPWQDVLVPMIKNNIQLSKFNLNLDPFHQHHMSQWKRKTIFLFVFPCRGLCFLFNVWAVSRSQIPSIQANLDLLVWWLEKNLPQHTGLVVNLTMVYSSLEGKPWPWPQHFPFTRAVGPRKPLRTPDPRWSSLPRPDGIRCFRPAFFAAVHSKLWNPEGPQGCRRWGV